MKMNILGAVASVALFASVPAHAGVLVADSGWQDDTLDSAGSPTEGSPWTFTVTKDSILSVTDGFLPGDTYTLSGDLTGITTFYAGSSSDVQASGFYGPNWTDSTFSKIALAVMPGTYTFSITGDGVAGTPAGFGLRLDTVGAVPEPASWVLMISGVGIVGGAMRRRRSAVRTSVSYA